MISTEGTHVLRLTILLCLCVGSSCDWLLGGEFGPVQVKNFNYEAAEGEVLSGIEITNQLISRKFLLSPTFGTIDYVRNSSFLIGGEESLFRAVEPEGSIILDGYTYNIGALLQPNVTYGYCNRTSLTVSVDPHAFKYHSHKIGQPEVTIPWKPGTRHSPKLSWPPKGANLAVTFTAPDSVALPQHKDIEVTITYEMYQNTPILTKWMTISNNNGSTPVTVNHVTVELLAVNGGEGVYESSGSLAPDQGAVPPKLEVRTDQAHSTTVQWLNDYDRTHTYPHNIDDFTAEELEYGTSVRGWEPLEQGAVMPLLNCSYSSGPGVPLGGGARRKSLTTFRALQLVHDTTDMDRMSLARYHVTSLLAPWTTENPIFFHFADSITDANFQHAIDQMADVGFEMLIYSFGTNFSLETTDQQRIDEIANQVKYARSKGIEVGGYDLICLDRGHGGYGGNVGDQWDTVDQNGKLGGNACFASGWYDKLWGYVTEFVDKVGLSMLETDGPYGGSPCASELHAHHSGWDDSIYEQTQMQSHFYSDLRNRSVFINQPDNYFFQGGQKTGMGYNENQYSLPHWQDITISRQGMYDDLYTHIPTQGWMFVPLVQYHNGGSSAAFSPVSEHYAAYEFALAQYLGAGVAACYRGKQLYDSPATEALVKKWVSFYKAHRQTLISPIVHIRRATGQSWDGWIHVNAKLAEKGVAMIFNPTTQPMKFNLALPLYYTGLTTTASLSINNQPTQKFTLQRDYSVIVPLDMNPKTITTIVVTA